MNVAANIAGTRHISLRRVWALALWQQSESSHRRRKESLACSFWWLGGLPFFSWYLGASSEGVGVWSQHTPFSVSSLEVEMLEREIMCLMSVSLVFPVAVKCCSGFPGCFPESRPWLRSLGAVVIHHSSVGRAQLGCPWAVVVLAAWCYQCPCGMCQPHDDSEAEIKSCGHLYSVQVCVSHCGDTFLIHINQGNIDFYCTLFRNVQKYVLSYVLLLWLFHLFTILFITNVSFQV